MAVCSFGSRSTRFSRMQITSVYYFTNEALGKREIENGGGVGRDVGSVSVDSRNNETLFRLFGKPMFARGPRSINENARKHGQFFGYVSQRVSRMLKSLFKSNERRIIALASGMDSSYARNSEIQRAFVLQASSITRNNERSFPPSFCFFLFFLAPPKNGEFLRSGVEQLYEHSFVPPKLGILFNQRY